LEDADFPWGKDGDAPTYFICYCCGVEFGYEDSSVNSTKRYRDKWLAGGAQWFDPKSKPANWSLEEQLKLIPPEFR
jgi:hypothetical protein